MGVANNWTLRVKRKDNKKLTQEQIDAILSFDFYEEDKPNSLNILSDRYPEYEAVFYTDSYNAWIDIDKRLCIFTEEEPMISVQLDCVCTEYGGDDFTRTNFSNGKSESMDGYITFPDPEEVFY